MDPDFADALCEDESRSRSSDRQVQRKAQQLCRQVQRALNLALANCNSSDGVSGLFVEEVTPAPDCGRLLVRVLIPVGSSVAVVMEALRRDAPHFRSDVAMAISRKRTPELCFVPAALDGGYDE
jgi:ribosome-binding factor A